jgi:hypothetical protein
MRRIAGVLGAATVLVGALVGSTASSASTTGAANPTDTGRTATTGDWPPWIPYEQEDVTYPAGERCEFEVFGKVLRDKEFYRDIVTYADGSPRIQLWRGPLVMRFTNMDTGYSVKRDASGQAFFEYRPDGSFEELTVQKGHFVGGMPAGSIPSQGLFYVSGRWSSLVAHADGTRQLFLGPNGSAENLCETLAP